METDRYWGVHYRYCPVLRGSICGRGKGTTGMTIADGERGRGALPSSLKVVFVVVVIIVIDDFSTNSSEEKPYGKILEIDLFVLLCCSGGMAGQHYCLRWNNYQSNMTSVFHQLLQNEAFVDVTLACNEASLKAHKVG